MKNLLVFCFLAVYTLPAWGQPAENLLFITYDGLRFQELFGGADAKLLDPKSKQTQNQGVIKEKYWAESAEERREKLLPFFWNVIAKDGQVFGHKESGSVSLVTNGRNFSYPGYNEILTGAKDDRIRSNAKQNNPNVTVLEWLNKQPGFEGSVAAFCSWDVFPYIINEDRSGVPVNAGWEGTSPSVSSDRVAFMEQLANETPHFWAGVRFDPFTFYPAVEYIREHQPRVIYVAFGETDDWAHSGRYDLYLEAARQTDDYIRRLWELLQSIEQYAGKTALLMTTDHGRGDTIDDWKSHNAVIEGSERVWIAAMGAGVPVKGIVKNTETTQSQVAATGAALLGLEFKGDDGEAAAPVDF